MDESLQINAMVRGGPNELEKKLTGKWSEHTKLQSCLSSASFLSLFDIDL